MIGPWAHSQGGRVALTGNGADPTPIDFGDNAPVDMNKVYLRWFDYILKGVDNGLGAEPPIRIFVMGDNYWRFENEWPLARTRYTNYYILSHGKANSALGDGALSTARPESSMPDRFAYDPEHPVPSMGGNVCCSVVPSGPWDQRPVENRDDVLIYTTAPMTRSVEVTGPISMVLYAATSAKDTDWTAKLVDVYPNGYAQNVQSGIVRARYREGTGKPAKPIQPGQVTNTISICGPRARCSCRGIEFAWRFHRAIFPASTGTSTRGKTRARELYSPGGMARSTRLRSNLIEILRRSNQKNSRKESQEAGAGRELKAKRSLH